MTLKYFQKGFNYSQDGPGNRLVYHLHGCNMHCPWCSNPEGMTPGTVYKAFPATEADTGDIHNEILSCMPMFFDGGGVTFTGGEVSLQLEAVRELFEALTDDGINTAVETNATDPALPSLFPYLNLLIMDIKHPNADKLKSVTGGNLDTILKNLEAAVESKLPVLLRIPLIHGFNDSDEDIAEFIKLLSPFSDGIKLELLSYHEYGKEKWKKCGLEYKMTDAYIKESNFNLIKNSFASAGFTVVRT